MSFLCYERYKDSGVEWLGKVPAHWETRRLRFLVEIKKRIVGELGPDILSITQQGIRVRDAESNDGQVSMDYSKYQIVEPGDFAMNHMDLLTGYVDISKVRGVTSPDYRVFTTRPDGDCDERFLLYLFQNAYKSRIFFAFGQGSSQLGRWRLPTEAFNDFSMPLPPLREQSSIVTFLDSETAKIDALIEEQQRLIELLKEKRQTVISHAVTKGLDSAVQMRASGIDWLGQMPSHWRIEKIFRAFRASKGRNGQILTKEYCGQHDGSYPVFSGQTSDGGVMARIDEFEFDFAEPGVLFSTTVGAKAMDLKQIAGKFSLSQNCMIIWPTAKQLVLRFFYYHCQPLFQYERDMIPDHMQASFRMEDLYGYHIAMPPIEEQQQIASFLDEEICRFDSLTAEAEKQVDLLQERRSAIISAAVTGKISVRGYVPQIAKETHESA